MLSHWTMLLSAPQGMMRWPIFMHACSEAGRDLQQRSEAKTVYLTRAPIFLFGRASTCAHDPAREQKTRSERRFSRVSARYFLQSATGQYEQCDKHGR